MHSLVTGGAGFVGRHLVERLLREGHEVQVVDALVSGTGAINPLDGWPKFNPFDYKTFRFTHLDCREWFSSHQDAAFDYAFHLAAMVGGRHMIEEDPLLVATDLAIDSDYWRWAAQARPEKTVCFSSSAVYPVAFQQRDGNRPLFESMVTFQALSMPDMTYGWSKLTCEYLANVAYERYGLKSICIRPFSGYGIDQDSNYPFPAICRRVLEGQSTLRIWGSGQQIRDFIHIDDCIEGIIRMMDQIDNADAVNLSTGIGTSFFEFAQIACEVVGSRQHFVPLTNQPEGVFFRVGDTAKQVSLGFTAKISLREGIERAMACYEKEKAVCC